ncbi:hypothetical protein PJ985_12635 [Streptomyces sp. ACA25]|uniref:hypothetical protein n=1 Tax=Streptomyces sp. ACA25 TaxID=3022596 RepID=UPI002306E978|nr:hypothetical protein [Streptomyces sp. ACA25]MDB1088411.1 hypothetical protein [Streptomyces sp. ACA25]
MASPTCCATRRPPAVGRLHPRLPWWAPVLPVLVFAALLFLLVTGAEAGAAPEAEPVALLLEWLHRLLVR